MTLLSFLVFRHDQDRLINVVSIFDLPLWKYWWYDNPERSIIIRSYDLAEQKTEVNYSYDDGKYLWFVYRKSKLVYVIKTSRQYPNTKALAYLVSCHQLVESWESKITSSHEIINPSSDIYQQLASLFREYQHVLL